MADEHFFPVGDFPSGRVPAPFFGSSNPYAPPPGLDAAAMAPFGVMLPWASELPLPADSSATTATAHFDSALSSLVSSPAHAGCGEDDVAIGDLIGRLGSICNASASANNSCYSTPLSSPPRGASFRQGGGCCYPGPGAAPPGLQAGVGRLSRVASSKSLGAAVPEAETSPSAAGKAAEAPAKGGDCSGAARKRKAASGKQGKLAEAAGANNGSPKRSKIAGDGDEGAGNGAEEEKKPEPAKDYIHVRARRGQATDSHSLAERVRREKISERMKLLQSLVPGCNKITGKALMLDEIINYVQSLQRQVEFLSMKLSTMNPQLDVDARPYLPSSDDKDLMTTHHHQTAAAMLGCYPPQQDAGAFPFAVHPATMESCTGSSIFHPGFGGWEAAQDDLQSVVHHRHDPAPGHGFHAAAGGGQHQQKTAEATTVSHHMKVEEEPQ